MTGEGADRSLNRTSSARLPLFAYPGDEFGDRLMFEQPIDRVEVSPQFLFVRNQVVNRAVAIPADRDGFFHLIAREPLLEPLVGVAGAGDEMMFGRPAFRDSSAQLAKCHESLRLLAVVGAAGVHVALSECVRHGHGDFGFRHD